MKSTVIYHSADFDGIFCREIARKFHPDAELIGWNHGDPKLPFPDEGIVYVLDLSPDCFTLTTDGLPMRADKGFDGSFFRLIWIDHHKSAIEKFPSHIAGYRVDGVAACRLAWQWFANVDHGRLNKGHLIRKGHFIRREVTEPYAVRLAGEYDVWDKRDPDAELFQHGLKSRRLDDLWDLLLVPAQEENGKVDIGTLTTAALLEGGQVLQFARENEYAEVIKDQGFDVQFEGLTFLACNSHELDIRSHLFAAGIRPHHDGLLGFTFTGSQWRVSLYGVPGKPDIDLSAIAVRHGGGGHKQACGFHAVRLPFLP